MQATSTTAPAGTLALNVIRRRGDVIPIRPAVDVTADSNRLRDLARHGLPDSDLSDEVNAWRLRNARNLWRGLRRVAAARALGIQAIQGTLYGAIIRSSGEVVDLGLMSARVVTNNGAALIVDCLDQTGSLEAKYHGIGTGSTAENVTDSALVTELTTQYNPDSTRATGTFSQPSANVSRSVGTNSVDATAAVQEHGIFTQAATGGGTLLDRSVFSTVNLSSGDSLQSTYDLTVTAGS